MTDALPGDYDVFVGPPATVALVRRTIEYRLNSRSFSPAGWAPLGRDAAVHVQGHDLPDTMLRDNVLRVRLATDFPIRICLRSSRHGGNAVHNEALARRVFTQIRASRWPVVLTCGLCDVVEISRLR
jgi:hypothetical protein